MSASISPKSVVSTGTGYVFAQNMMYKHTITVYDTKTFKLVKTIPDRVVLADFGYKGKTASVQGAPVEAAETPDHRFMYVSQYSMYGPGFYHEGHDVGGPSSGFDKSFVYRVRLSDLKIDKVIKVGVGAQVRRRHARPEVRAGEQLGLLHSQRRRRAEEQADQADLPRARTRAASPSRRTPRPPTSRSWAATTSPRSTSGRST